MQITQAEREPTHRCKVCNALWIQYPTSWSLFSQYCGACCDNKAMGEQIEPIGDLLDGVAIEIAYGRHVSLTPHDIALKVIKFIASAGSNRHA